MEYVENFILFQQDARQADRAGEGPSQVSETRTTRTTTRTATRTTTRTTARTTTRRTTTITGPDPECAADPESADRRPTLRYDRTRWSTSPSVGPSVEVGRVVDLPLSWLSQSTLLRRVGLRSRLLPKGRNWRSRLFFRVWWSVCGCVRARLLTRLRCRVIPLFAGSAPFVVFARARAVMGNRRCRLSALGLSRPADHRRLYFFLCETRCVLVHCAP